MHAKVGDVVFEVKKPEFINKTFRLEKKLVEELNQCASENDISLNALVAQCCRYALDHQTDTIQPHQNKE